ncbi:cation:proton antiporter domain-containing protein [Legionella tunisiensis]|uniref:cation:proton antiporter domain-containing protein n=1 Tax=Legionella tunisiensis TaxID=1034944 RepID=UPI0002EC69ED|nr:cation:proton antiporter [Legionella tunisiensis]
MGAVIGAVIIVGRYLSRYLFLTIAKTNLREVFTACSLALIVGITLLMDSIGVSAALGAFIAGVVLANSEYRHTIETDIQPFKGLLLGLFFISVGMGMNFALFSQQPVILIASVLILVAIKASILFVLGRAFGLTSHQTAGFAFGLAQGGEFAFVLLQYADQSNVISQSTAGFLLLRLPFL